jgi:hypothetical protein
MKALEFESVLTPECTLLVPLAIAAQVPQGKPLRVMVFLSEETDTPAQWKDQGAQQLQGEDHNSDTLYDEPAGS